MAGLAALYNVPGTQEELEAWSFVHMAHHRDINKNIFELTGLQIPDAPLDPVPLHDLGQWLEQHQVMHQQMDEILGIVGFDLSDVDWEDPNQLAGWIFLNANEHVQASDILLIG